MIPIVDSRSGRVVRVGQQVRNGPDTDDWYTIARVLPGERWLSRTAVVVRHDGSTTVIPMPVKIFPRLTYGPAFPVGGWRCCIFPS